MSGRTWNAGDSEPEDLPALIDAFGDRWFMSSERTPGYHDGWRSNQMSYSDNAKTWWWLSMYRGPLREDV